MLYFFDCNILYFYFRNIKVNIVLFFIILLFSYPVNSQEIICGWLDNPTPNNNWLIDKDGYWNITQQGGRVAKGFYEVFDTSKEESLDMIYTNGYYGLSCVCLSADIDYLNKNILRVYEFESIKIQNCLDDNNLKTFIDLQSN